MQRTWVWLNLLSLIHNRLAFLHKAKKKKKKSIIHCRKDPAEIQAYLTKTFRSSFTVASNNIEGNISLEATGLSNSNVCHHMSERLVWARIAPKPTKTEPNWLGSCRSKSFSRREHWSLCGQVRFSTMQKLKRSSNATGKQWPWLATEEDAKRIRS